LCGARHVVGDLPAHQVQPGRLDACGELDSLPSSLEGYMAIKNARAGEARAKAQAQVKNKERRTTVMIIAASLAVIAIFGGIVYFIVQQSAVPPLSEAHRPAGSDLTGGIPVGASGVAGEEGLTEGAARVDLYLDLLCPV